MVKVRILTAVVLLSLAIIIVLLLPNFYFSIITTVLLSLAGWEWAQIAGLGKKLERGLYLAVLWLCFLVTLFLPLRFILMVSVLWWLLAFYWVIRYPNIGKNLSGGRITRCLTGLFVLVPCWPALNALHNIKPLYLLFMLAIVWFADIGAYFIGRWKGKHKLASKVSPKKTVEGLFGGLLFALTTAIIFGSFMFTNFNQRLLWLALVIVAILFSVVGDLFESVLKRTANLKDSGSLLPGHGGILDRIDSMTAAMPIFALGMLLMF